MPVFLSAGKLGDGYTLSILRDHRLATNVGGVGERLKRREKVLREFVDGLGEKFYLVLLLGIAVGALATGAYEATIGCVIFAGGYLAFVRLSGQKPPFTTNGRRRYRG